MRKLRIVKHLTVAQLIKDLQGFDPELPARFCSRPGNEMLILSVYGVTRKEAKRNGLKAGEVVGVWIDLEEQTL